MEEIVVRKKSKHGTGNFGKCILPSFPFRRHSVLQSLKNGSLLRKTFQKSSFWRHQKTVRKYGEGSKMAKQ